MKEPIPNHRYTRRRFLIVGATTTVALTAGRPTVVRAQSARVSPLPPRPRPGDFPPIDIPPSNDLIGRAVSEDTIEVIGGRAGGAGRRVRIASADTPVPFNVDDTVGVIGEDRGDAFQADLLSVEPFEPSHYAG